MTNACNFDQQGSSLNQGAESTMILNDFEKRMNQKSGTDRYPGQKNFLHTAKPA